MELAPTPKGVDLPGFDAPGRAALLIHLWADLFKHLSTLGVAASAGLLVLLQADLLEGGSSFWVSLAMMASGSLLAFSGSAATVKLVEDNGGSTKPLRRLLQASTFLLGIGTGILAASIVLP